MSSRCAVVYFGTIKARNQHRNWQQPSQILNKSLASAIKEAFYSQISNFKIHQLQKRQNTCFQEKRDWVENHHLNQVCNLYFANMKETYKTEHCNYGAWMRNYW
jgi:hypothetical protein